MLLEMVNFKTIY